MSLREVLCLPFTKEVSEDLRELIHLCFPIRVGCDPLSVVK